MDNNPINYIDPRGLLACPDECKEIVWEDIPMQTGNVRTKREKQWAWTWQDFCNLAISAGSIICGSTMPPSTKVYEILVTELEEWAVYKCAVEICKKPPSREVQYNTCFKIPGTEYWVVFRQYTEYGTSVLP